MSNKNVLLISGSHRGKQTTTNAILDYIESTLLLTDYEVVREQVPKKIPGDKFSLRLSKEITKCDKIVICFPLYFDTLPYPLLSFLEAMRKQQANARGADMYVIVHCGLPESNHCKNALAVCKCFGEYIGANLKGEVIIPDTGAVEGSDIKKIKRIRTVLDKMTGIMISENSATSNTSFIANPSVNPYVFRVIGNIIMKHFARKNKADIFQNVYQS